jgi:CP family cyanate transporter-like MFS transporter
MREKTDSRWVVDLGLVCLLTWAVFGSLVSTSGLIEWIRKDLDLSYSQSGFLLSVPFPLITASALVGGILVDRLGAPKMIHLGATLVFLGGALRAWSGSFWALALGIILVGAGTGVIFPVLPKVARDTAPPGKRALSAGLYTASLVTGASMGVAVSVFFAPVWHLVPFSTGQVSWRGGYAVWGLATLAAFLLWRWFRSAETEVGEKVPAEIVGDGNEFYLWRSRAVWAVTGALLVNNTIFYTSVGWLPSLLQGKGWTLLAASWLASLVSWLGAIAVLTAHYVSPWVGGDRNMVYLCGFGTAIGLALIPLGGAWTGVSAIILVGFTLNFWFVLCMGFPARAIPADKVGQAGGMIIGLGYFGGFVGPWAVGAVRDAAGGFGPAFFALAALSAIGAFAAPYFEHRAA